MCHEGTPINQWVVAMITLRQVSGLDITDIVQLMDEQRVSRRLDKLIRGLANGDINCPSWADSAKARLSA